MTILVTCLPRPLPFHQPIDGPSGTHGTGGACSCEQMAVGELR